MLRLDKSYLLGVCAGMLLSACVNYFPNDELRLRVEMVATVGGEAPQIIDGLVDMGNNIYIYTALLHIGSVDVHTDATVLRSNGSVNVDLLRRMVIFETQREDTWIDSVTVDVPQPPEGSGVVAGERIAVFIGGLIDEAPFEYRATALGGWSIEIAEELPLSETVLTVAFDLQSWFSDIDLSQLEEGVDGYRIDAENNSEEAAAIEENIKEAAAVDYELDD